MYVHQSGVFCLSSTETTRYRPFDYYRHRRLSVLLALSTARMLMCCCDVTSIGALSQESVLRLIIEKSLEIDVEIKVI